MLRVDELDLAFLSVTERIESHALCLHQLVSEELVVILPIEHCPAKRRKIRMHELADEEFISYREGARLRELLVTAGRQAGFEPNDELESNESARIRMLVARSMGVAILPLSDAIGPGAEIAVTNLTEPALMRDITLAWRAGRRLPPAAAEFIERAGDLPTRGLATRPAQAKPLHRGPLPDYESSRRRDRAVRRQAATASPRKQQSDHRP